MGSYIQKSPLVLILFVKKPKAPHLIIFSELRILVMGTALTSPILDVIGPRWFAAIGLSSECVGLGVLAHTVSYDHGVLILSFAYGLVGLGGNMLMLSSMPFCQLFRHSSTAASIMMGAYQASSSREVLWIEPQISLGVQALGSPSKFSCSRKTVFLARQLASCSCCLLSRPVSLGVSKRAFGLLNPKPLNLRP